MPSAQPERFKSTMQTACGRPHTIDNFTSMVPWQHVETVFLDLDGTLLDLHFDNQFWREHVPLCYALQRGLEVEVAKSELFPRYQRVEGTIDWYCIDYWSRKLALDIAALKQELEHLITLHPHALKFLEAVRDAGKRLLLVTNAHAKSLALKLDRTGLAEHFDAVICAHDLGIPKEYPGFWKCLRQQQAFLPSSTLLIDDSLAVLRAARQYGIAHLLGIYQPDSQAPPKETEEFTVLRSFCEIMPFPV